MNLLLIALTVFASSDTADPLPGLLAANSHSIRLETQQLTGPGAELLLDAAANAQFVALGEAHNNRDIPLLSQALFRQLNHRYGFNYLATEQDPLMMQRISSGPVRGDLSRVNALARQYPYGFTFVSDQELAMLAGILDLSSGRHDPVWGAEQAFGATHYLEELIELAPTEAAGELVRALHAEASEDEADRDVSNRHYMSRTDAKRPRFLALREAFAPRPGSRAEFLIEALIKSDEIYGYYHRAVAGEVVGLYNNSVREDYMKRRFMTEYRRAEAADGKQPRVLLKYGSWHLFHGRGPGNVYTIGNFVQEFSIANGMETIGVMLLTSEKAGFDPQAPAWLGPLLPEQLSEWTLVDLRPLRPYAHARKIGTSLSPKDLDLFIAKQQITRSPAGNSDHRAQD
jgi:hypothetical protein